MLLDILKNCSMIRITCNPGSVNSDKSFRTLYHDEKSLLKIKSLLYGGF